MKYENLKKELVDLIHESTYGTFWITNYYKDARQGLGIILLFIVIFFTNMKWIQQYLTVLKISFFLKLITKKNGHNYFL